MKLNFETLIRFNFNICLDDHQNLGFFYEDHWFRFFKVEGKLMIIWKKKRSKEYNWISHEAFFKSPFGSTFEFVEEFTDPEESPDLYLKNQITNERHLIRNTGTKEIDKQIVLEVLNKCFSLD